MPKKDFAFLFYVNDWAGGTQWMSRLQRGGYLDLLLYQVNNHKISFDEIKQILGDDFERCWDKLSSKFIKDDNGFYYNKKMSEVIELRSKFTESRRNNRNQLNNDSLFVYLMKNNENGYIKIGSSVSPEKRFLDLKRKYPQLELLYSFGKTPQTTEKKLHDEFKEYCIYNEFYKLNQKQIKYILSYAEDELKLQVIKHKIEQVYNHLSKQVGNENEKESVIENEKKMVGEVEFDNFRKLYPGTKRGNETEFTNFTKKHEDWKAVLNDLSPALNKQIAWRKEAGLTQQFVPQWANLQTWINQRRWEEEMGKIAIQSQPGRSGPTIRMI